MTKPKRHPKLNPINQKCPDCKVMNKSEYGLIVYIVNLGHERQKYVFNCKCGRRYRALKHLHFGTF